VALDIVLVLRSIYKPGHADRHYRVATKRSDAMYADPEIWLTKTPQKGGSWWPEWSGGSMPTQTLR
jgi:poly(3-hydroxyalkanoate) synthetase